MNRPTAFWDASALVPFCIEEANTKQVEAYSRMYSTTVWWASEVEVFSAISRLHRTGGLSKEGQERAIRALRNLAETWSEVLPDSGVRETACRILDLHALKAADSFQLAAALTWCRNRPTNRVFICADRKLSDAAELTGFAVHRLGQGAQ